MTSSTSTTNQSCNKQAPLTDFSIESIIGNLSGSSSPASERASFSLPEAGEIATSATVSPEIGIHNRLPTRQKVKKFRPKNFPCPACKMAFSNNGQLKNHLRIHTGERPFRCNQSGCNKTFTRNEELTRHKLIHTGVRPHTCNCCGKRFGRKDHLKKHVKTHDRKKYKKRLFACRVPSPASPAKVSSLEVAGSFLDAETNSKHHPHRSTNTTPLAPPITTNHHHHHHHRLTNMQSPASIVVTNQMPTPSLFQFPNSIMAATSDAIQQFASDYWSRWYNLMGVCHQDQTNQLDLFGQRKL